MRLVLSAVFLVCVVSALPAQTNDKWQRVYTGDESVIDVNISSRSLKADHILRADFRTVLAKPENIDARSRIKFKTRIETIDFKLNLNDYSVSDTTWFDAKGEKLYSYTPPSEIWRAIKVGGVMERMLNAVRGLEPFGSWEVVDYRFVEAPMRRTQELDKLVGVKVLLRSDRAAVGPVACSKISYEDKKLTREEFSRDLGVAPDQLKIQLGADVETTRLACEVSGWRPPQSLVVRTKDGEMLMLWQGVFLILKKETQWSGDLLQPLKRRDPR